MPITMPQKHRPLAVASENATWFLAG